MPNAQNKLLNERIIETSHKDQTSPRPWESLIFWIFDTYFGNACLLRNAEQVFAWDKRIHLTISERKAFFQSKYRRADILQNAIYSRRYTAHSVAANC